MDKQMMKKVGIIAGIIVGALLLVALILVALNRSTIVWNVENGAVLHWEYGYETTDNMPSAEYRGKLWAKNGRGLTPSMETSVDYNQLGEQEVTFVAKWGLKKAKLTVTYEVSDQTGPEITLVSDPNYFTSPIAEYEEEGFTAIDKTDGDVTASVVREEKDGKVYYTAKDSFGNTTTVVRDIVYKDVVYPVIELTEGTAIDANVGDEYVDPGYLATDDVDGDITAKVQVSGTVDTSVPGTYTLTYSVSDGYQNTTSVDRVVTVKDIAPPVLTLEGNSICYLKLGETYTESGCSASDAVDGTVSVTTSGSVDTSKCGVYKINYSASDNSGNTGYATRTVYVFEKQVEVNATAPSGDKIVYLTFDDGPGPHTQKLLDVLDKYDVKATFFVTNQRPDYQYMIGETARRGHTIAVHTYSHVYETIYASPEAFLEDFQKMNEIVKAQTGSYAWLHRFPGGSSTGYIHNFKSLSDVLSNIGVKYCDWNITSGDAGETRQTSQVVQNVIAGMKSHKTSIVLQHDIHKFSVEAVEEIIVWGLANGYTFLPMTPETQMVHFK